MILGNIREFDWINEPENVSFTESGLQITALPETDFWQNIDENFSKDSGHLFAVAQDSDFVLDCKWYFEKIKDSAQCGIMARVDERNWIKFGLLSPNVYLPQIGAIVANRGSSDWSMVEIPDNTQSLWFKLRRCKKDFICYYSLDGEKYHTIRMVHLPTADKSVRVGAYACSPKSDGFECVLEEIRLKRL